MSQDKTLVAVVVTTHTHLITKNSIQESVSAPIETSVHALEGNDQYQALAVYADVKAGNAISAYLAKMCREYAVPFATYKRRIKQRDDFMTQLYYDTSSEGLCTTLDSHALSEPLAAEFGSTGFSTITEGLGVALIEAANILRDSTESLLNTHHLYSFAFSRLPYFVPHEYRLKNEDTPVQIHPYVLEGETKLEALPVRTAQCVSHLMRQVAFFTSSNCPVIFQQGDLYILHYVLFANKKQITTTGRYFKAYSKQEVEAALEKHMMHYKAQFLLEKLS